MKLIRKVTPAKWTSAAWSSTERIPADAITLCTRTSGNTLSFWMYDENEFKKNDALLALLGSMDRFDTIHYIEFDQADFSGMDFSKEPGDTAFESLRSLHVDIANLDHERLVAVGKVISSRVLAATGLHRVSRRDFMSMMQRAVTEGKIDALSLPKSMRDELTNRQLI